MEWAKAQVINTPLFESYKAPDNLNDIYPGMYLLYGLCAYQLIFSKLY